MVGIAIEEKVRTFINAQTQSGITPKFPILNSQFSILNFLYGRYSNRSKG